MKLQEVDTVQDLTLWVQENMPGAKVVEGVGGVEIHTGLVVTMGGYLYGEGEAE